MGYNRERPLPRPLPHKLEAYYDAMSGEGDVAYDWKDKPHRLIYDLIAYCRFLEEELECERTAHAETIAGEDW